MFLIHWKAENGPLAADRNVWEIWSDNPISFPFPAPQLLAACGSESEALLRAAAMGKKPWLTVRDDAVSQVWRLEDLS